MLDLLDRIVQESPRPFKIMIDYGFIVEDTIDNEYTSMSPNENEVERSIPFIITKNAGIGTYKHIREDGKIHISSSHRYVAIYGFLFKVVKLNRVGAKFRTQGHTFLSKLKSL